jgi:hypothetical protein
VELYLISNIRLHGVILNCAHDQLYLYQEPLRTQFKKVTLSYVYNEVTSEPTIT